MKEKYTAPAVETDELIKEDVLLASGEPKRNGIYNIEDTAKNWSLEDFL